MQELIQTLRDKYGHNNFKIVHDNARFATSNKTIDFMRLHNYTRFSKTIPPYSPDINIIENMWALLKRKVKEYTFEFGQPKRRTELIEFINTKWSAISQNIIDNLYNSLHLRMQLIIESLAFQV